MRHWMLLLLVLIFATPTLAVDGVLEINQTCAVQTGCIDNSGGIGDTPGFPVNIEIPGSYILTSNLVVSDPNTSGLFIAAAPVTIDLNGFEIQGSVNCTGFGSSLTCDAGTGVGIRSGSVRTTVVNGSVIKFGSDGIRMGGRSRVERVVVERNGGNGVKTGSDSVVIGCRAYRNGGNGIETSDGSIVESSTSASNRASGFMMANGAVISASAARDNGDDGIEVGVGSTVSNNTAFQNESTGIVAFAGSTVSGNTSYQNGFEGISAGGAGSSVQRNTVRSNGRFGLNFTLGVTTAYRENVITGNVGGTVLSGVNMGDNYCEGPGVISASCP